MTRRLTLLVILVTLAMPGCDSSPTDIVGGPLTFEGVLTSDAVDEHSLVITKPGGVRIEALSITADPPLDEGLTPTIGFGFGEPDIEGTCIPSFSANLTEGINLSLGLDERTYCILVSDNGSILEDTSRTYVIQVRSSE